MTKPTPHLYFTETLFPDLLARPLKGKYYDEFIAGLRDDLDRTVRPSTGGRALYQKIGEHKAIYRKMIDLLQTPEVKKAEPNLYQLRHLLQAFCNNHNLAGDQITAALNDTTPLAMELERPEFPYNPLTLSIGVLEIFSECLAGQEGREKDYFTLFRKREKAWEDGLRQYIPKLQRAGGPEQMGWALEAYIMLFQAEKDYELKKRRSSPIQSMVKAIVDGNGPLSGRRPVTERAVAELFGLNLNSQAGRQELAAMEKGFKRALFSMQMTP